ncbi:MAG: hypothetical protein ACTSV2_07545, partial [Candidatus Thorarchaeota archaeon]
TLIKQSESIIRAGEVDLFRYAESRKDALDELAPIVRSRKEKPKNSKLSESEITYACDLRRKGLSYGEITRRIFHDIGTSWDISTIEHAIKRTIPENEYTHDHKRK